MSSIEVASGLRPWQFFLIASLLASSAAILLVPDTQPAALVLASAVVCAAGLVGLGVYRTLAPLVAAESVWWRPSLRGGPRVAIEREKQLILRVIKELEFDRAMRKVADRDFEEMMGRLRRRALRLMEQLDALEAGEGRETAAPRRYRDAIERDLAALLGADAGPPPEAHGCRGCGTRNDADARFCKACGQTL